MFPSVFAPETAPPSGCLWGFYGSRTRGNTDDPPCCRYSGVFDRFRSQMCQLGGELAVKTASLLPRGQSSRYIGRHEASNDTDSGGYNDQLRRLSTARLAIAVRWDRTQMARRKKIGKYQMDAHRSRIPKSTDSARNRTQVCSTMGRMGHPPALQRVVAAQRVAVARCLPHLRA